MLRDNIKADFLMAYPEIIERFCWQIYGINVSDFIENIKSSADSEKAMADLYKHLREQADMNMN
jgi:predicted kinase